MRRSSANFSLMPPLTISLSQTAPSTRTAPWRRSATRSGVPPSAAMSCTKPDTASGNTPPLSATRRSMASGAPLSRLLPPGRLTPLMRVCAVKGRKVAPRLPMSRWRMPNFSLASTTMLRPSGVSSTRLESCAASASSASVTPGAGRKALAWRLPRVMVPVLSSSSTSTSPAASTARPLMAMTPAWMSLSMPAMPMADKSPPMVVGARQTKRAAKTVMLMASPLPAWATPNREKGSSVAHTSRKMMVSAARRMLSAISLGVLRRLAPSTMLIMRSRKVSPGSAEMRTTMESDSTRVPPVTALRSPPASRITGADSPVMADSSTVATPSLISPSAGIISPAATRTTSPLRSRSAGIFSMEPESRMRLARVWVRVRRRVSAWALPRPSAMASAKLANRTVNQSHSAT